MAMVTVRVGAVLALAAGLCGCVANASGVETTASVAAAPSAVRSPAGWATPVRVLPLPIGTNAEGEPTMLSWVPDVGFVRATPAALASVGRPLEADPGPNRTVEPCRAVVGAEAAKVGARAVEAASAGPERAARDGRVFAPVRLRITYARPTGTEVREATMTCVVDRGGRIVDAYVAAP